MSLAGKNNKLFPVPIPQTRFNGTGVFFPSKVIIHIFSDLASLWPLLSNDTGEPKKRQPGITNGHIGKCQGLEIRGQNGNTPFPLFNGGGFAKLFQIYRRTSKTAKILFVRNALCLEVRRKRGWGKYIPVKSWAAERRERKLVVGETNLDGKGLFWTRSNL